MAYLLMPEPLEASSDGAPHLSLVLPPRALHPHQASVLMELMLVVGWEAFQLLFLTDEAAAAGCCGAQPGALLPDGVQLGLSQAWLLDSVRQMQYFNEQMGPAFI